MKTAGALIRVSTAKQLEGTSPEKQIEKILSLASSQGYNIPDQYIWQLAESGNLRQREGFVNALKAGDSGEISRIYVFNIDRLGRNLLEMLLFLRTLDDIGIDCWGAERGTRLRGDDFILQIEGAVASKERQEIVKRTKDGLERAVKAGKYSGGIVAYGFMVNPETKKLEIRKSEAKIISQIFDWCTEERLSCVEIAERLNALKIPTHYQKDGRKIKRKGKRSPEYTAGIWRSGRIGNILKNSAYMGKWVYGKRSKTRMTENLITSECPAIVSEDQFIRAKDVLGNNRIIKSSGNRENYLLRGLIKCENCGLSYCGTYSLIAPKRTTKRTYYICNGKTQWKKLGKPKCESASLKAEEIEQVIWEELKNFCKHPDTAINQLREQHHPQEDNLEESIAEVLSQVKDLDRQEKNILKISIESTIVDPKALDEQLIQNHQEKKILQDYLSTLKSDEVNREILEDGLLSVAERLKSLGSRIENASFEEKRRAILELVKGISVESQKVDGKITPFVTITFAFNQPPKWEKEKIQNAAMIGNHTSVLVAIMATR